MARLDEARQEREEPRRIAYAKEKLGELGIDIAYEDPNEIQFEHNGNIIKFWPFSGWHSGKGIKDGRGIKKLLEQLK